MKTPLLLLLVTALAFADAPPAQVVIKAQFIETDAAGKEDVMSAPTVATRHGNKATIMVGREAVLAPLGDDKALRQAINTGVELEVTPQVRDGDIVLVGRAVVREQDGKPDDGTTLAFNTRELIFVAVVPDGGQKEIKLGPVDGRVLTVRLTASKKEMRNAAVTYWQAFAALPSLNDTQRKLIDPKNGDTGDAARALIEQGKGAIDLLEKASSEDYCEWDLDLKQGPELKLPQIAPAQTLARLALLRARLLAAAGDQAGALVDRLAALRLSVDVSRPALLICRLVGIAIETPVLEALAAQLPMLDEAQQARVAAALGTLANAPGVAECVKVEDETFGGWMEAQLEARVRADGVKFDAAQWIGELLAPMSSDGKRAETASKLSIHTADEARKLIADYRSRMRELAKLSEAPRAEFERESRKFFERLTAQPTENVLASMAIPAIDKVRVSELKARTRLALLRAALEVQVKGESALPAELATYRKTERGFELTSKELFDGKPVVLAVGR